MPLGTVWTVDGGMRDWQPAPASRALAMPLESHRQMVETVQRWILCDSTGYLMGGVKGKTKLRVTQISSLGDQADSDPRS